MPDFMRVKYENPKLKQSQTGNQIGLSTSTLQRCRNDKNMLSPYKINPNNTNKRTKKTSNTNFDNNSHTNHDVKRPQLTSNDLKRPKSLLESHQEVKSVKSKNKLRGGTINGINEHFLDEILDNKNV